METATETHRVEIPEHLAVESLKGIPADASERLTKTRHEEERSLWQTKDQLENAANIVQRKDPADIQILADQMREVYPDLTADDTRAAAEKNFDAYTVSLEEYNRTFALLRTSEKDSILHPESSIHWENVKRQREAVDAVRFKVHTIAGRLNRIGTRSAVPDGISPNGHIGENGNGRGLDEAFGPKLDVTDGLPNGTNGAGENGHSENGQDTPNGVGPNGLGSVDSPQAKASSTSGTETPDTNASSTPPENASSGLSSTSGEVVPPMDPMTSLIRDDDLNARLRGDRLRGPGKGASFVTTSDAPPTPNGGGLETPTGTPANVDMSPKLASSDTDQQTTRPEDYADPQSSSTYNENDNDEQETHAGKLGRIRSMIQGFNRHTTPKVRNAVVRGAFAGAALVTTADAAIHTKPQENPVVPPGYVAGDPGFGRGYLDRVQEIKNTPPERGYTNTTDTNSDAYIPPDGIARPAVGPAEVGTPQPAERGHGNGNSETAPETTPEVVVSDRMNQIFGPMDIQGDHIIGQYLNERLIALDVPQNLRGQMVISFSESLNRMNESAYNPSDPNDHLVPTVELKSHPKIMKAMENMSNAKTQEEFDTADSALITALDEDAPAPQK